MSLYARTAEERCSEAEAEQEREFPACEICDGNVGWDCKGHCLNCSDEPAKGEDFCPACVVKINQHDNTAAGRRAAGQ